jgi:osmotically inducible lipoprotein OsmB
VSDLDLPLDDLRARQNGDLVKLVPAFVALAAVAAAMIGCMTTHKVVNGAAVGGGTGFLVGGPIGAAAGAAIGAVAAPVGSAALAAD